MADKPATMKDIAALEKKVDELRKWFLDEKKQVHTELDSITKFAGELSKSTADQINERQKWAEDESSKLRKWIEETLSK